MDVPDPKNESPRRTSPLSKPTDEHFATNNANADSNEDDDAAHDVESDSESKPQAPLQKRRRVTRACDECRRKKIKCDGKQPCTHCTVYSYDCTYDQPSNRRRNPAPQYIESLEQRLQKAEAIIRAVVPSINIDDPKYDARGVEQILESSKATQSIPKNTQQRPEDDGQMRSMVDRTGSLDLDDAGYYDYHGHSSGYTFMRKFRAQFGDDFLPNPKPIPKPIEKKNLSNTYGSPKSFHSSPVEAGISLSNDLPPKHVAVELCRSALDDCCALQRPLHRPTFFRRLSAIYSTDPEHYNNEDVKFLPLLYATMSVGSLFARADDEQNELDKKGYRYATEQGYQYFNLAKTMLDITDCRDMISIQAVMFMVLFLQGTAKLSTCYAYVGVALRACCRLGMHRRIATKFSVVEQEERKRLFWQVRKMDIYIGAMLGLPQMLSSDDIDQELPLEVYDEHINEEGISPIPREAFPLMKATNAHTKLLGILRKVVRYVYPVKPMTEAQSQAPSENMVSHSLIRELERDLQNWMDELPMQLRPSENSDIELSRVQQLLRMSYAYVQMMIYRPFLHYVSQACQNAKTDKRSFACAAACVSVARNIVHITTEMKRRGLLMGAYWFVMYTTYFAILSLLYFVLENPESSTSKDILKDAIEGRDTLANLATRSMAADRCTSSLTGLFEALPEKLSQRRSSLRAGPLPNTSKKRPPPTQDPPFFGNSQASAQFTPNSAGTPQTYLSTPARTRANPQEYVKSATKRLSVPDPSGPPGSSYPFTPDSSFPNIATPTETIGYGSSNSGTPAPLDFGTPAMAQGQLPDLKNLMFPGDNPFAYPNQPISTLDTMPSLPFGNEPQVHIDPYEPSNKVNVQQPFQQRFSDRPMFSQDSFRPPEHHMQPQTNFFGMNNMSDEPSQLSDPAQSRHTLHVPGQGTDDDYWTHAPAKGHFRTGLTPGGTGVNLDLDDIFGQGQSWGMPLNLQMPESQQHTQAPMQWNASSGPHWQ